MALGPNQTHAVVSRPVPIGVEVFLTGDQLRAVREAGHDGGDVTHPEHLTAALAVLDAAAEALRQERQTA